MNAYTDGEDTSRFPNAGELRDWAFRVSPRAVSPKGRLPLALLRAWNKAHPDRPFVEAESQHGTKAGYERYGCRCARCLDVGRRYGRDQYRAGAQERKDAS